MKARTVESKDIEDETLLHYCYAKKEKIDSDECFAISSDKRNNNKYCKKHGCKSTSRLCLSCVSYNEVDKDSFVIRPGAGLCVFHTANGYMIRKDDDPKSTKKERELRIELMQIRVNAGKNCKNKDGDDENIELLATSDDVKEYVDGVGIVDTSDEAIGEVKQEQTSVVQELNVTYGKEVLSIDPARIRRQPDQIREEFDEEALKELEETIRTVGQIIPGLVIKVEDDSSHDYELDDGERRWICCSRINIKFRAIVIEVGSKAQQFAVSAIANIGRQANTKVEVAKAIARMKKELGWSTARVAKALGMCSGYADQHLSILKLHEDVQKLMSPHRKRDEQLQIGIANSLNKFPLNQQLKHAEYILGKKMRVDPARAYLKKEAAKIGITVQTRKKKPSKSHENLMRFLDMTEDRLKKYLEGMTSREFTEMFRVRSDTHVIAVRRQVGSIIKSFEKISKRI